MLSMESETDTTEQAGMQDNDKKANEVVYLLLLLRQVKRVLSIHHRFKNLKFKGIFKTIFFIFFNIKLLSMTFN